MFKRKAKPYLVTLISDRKKEVVEVRAVSSKEAVVMVEDIINKCSLFDYLGKVIEIRARRFRK